MLADKQATLLEVKNLNSGYGKKQVLFDLSLEINAGEIVVLIGNNGSGKSTLLKSIFRLTNPTEDFINKHTDQSIHFGEHDITNMKPYALAGKGLVYIPHKTNTFERLTVTANLAVVVAGLSAHQVKNRMDEVFAELPNLLNLRHRMPIDLSGGERQQLALGMALMLQPKMILLDEPGAGLSASTWGKNLQIIKNLNCRGVTFLIVEHRVKEILPFADRVIGLRYGKIVFNELTGNDGLSNKIKELY